MISNRRSASREKPFRSQPILLGWLAGLALVWLLGGAIARILARGLAVEETLKLFLGMVNVFGLVFVPILFLGSLRLIVSKRRLRLVEEMSRCKYSTIIYLNNSEAKKFAKVGIRIRPRFFSSYVFLVAEKDALRFLAARDGSVVQIGKLTAESIISTEFSRVLDWSFWRSSVRLRTSGGASIQLIAIDKFLGMLVPASASSMRVLKNHLDRLATSSPDVNGE